MFSIKSLAAVTTLALVSACASPGADDAAKKVEQAGHHPGAAPAAAMPAMQERMQAMREMHGKMMNANTPAERQALMADHMKSMQDGMAMMKDMGGMGGMGAAGGTGGMSGMAGMAGMGEGKGMPAEMAKHHQMMQGRMEMMQMMMDMMQQRLPNPAATR